jgi:hypothetical protein
MGRLGCVILDHEAVVVVGEGETRDTELLTVVAVGEGESGDAELLPFVAVVAVERVVAEVRAVAEIVEGEVVVANETRHGGLGRGGGGRRRRDGDLDACCSVADDAGPRPWPKNFFRL